MTCSLHRAVSLGFDFMGNREIGLGWTDDFNCDCCKNLEYIIMGRVMDELVCLVE